MQGVPGGWGGHGVQGVHPPIPSSAEGRESLQRDVSWDGYAAVLKGAKRPQNFSWASPQRTGHLPLNGKGLACSWCRAPGASHAPQPHKPRAHHPLSPEPAGAAGRLKRLHSTPTPRAGWRTCPAVPAYRQTTRAGSCSAALPTGKGRGSSQTHIEPPTVTAPFLLQGTELIRAAQSSCWGAHGTAGVGVQVWQPPPGSPTSCWMDPPGSKSLRKLGAALPGLSAEGHQCRKCRAQMRVWGMSN